MLALLRVQASNIINILDQFRFSIHEVRIANIDGCAPVTAGYIANTFGRTALVILTEALVLPIVGLVIKEIVVGCISL